MKIVTTVAEHIEYFRQLAESIPGINDFVFGDSDMILGKDRSDLNYPVLWLESPEVDWQFSADLKEDFDTVFLILENVPNDEWGKRSQVTDYTLELTKYALVKIYEDHRANIIEVDLGRVKSFLIDSIGNNGDRGWRTQGLVFKTHQSKCLPDIKQQSLCPIGTLAKFTWTNETAGDFSALTITNITMPVGAGWTWKWTWSIDNGPTGEAITSVPTISSAGNCIYLQLEITLGDCIRYASVEIPNTRNSGISQPGKLKNIVT